MTLDEVKYMTESEVREAKTISGDSSATLDRCEVLDRGILSSALGFGSTPKKAREALAEKLSNQRVVKDAFGWRREFLFPEVTV